MLNRDRPTLAEVVRRLDDMDRESARQFDTLRQHISSRTVPVELYRSEAQGRDRAIASVQSSLRRLYAFGASLVVGIVAAVVSSIGALVVAIVVSAHH